jgi:HK97 family phage major capsid protein
MKTIEELRARQKEIHERLMQIDTEAEGRALAEEVQKEWDELDAESVRTKAEIERLETRAKRVEEIRAAAEAGETERGTDVPNVPTRNTPDDVHDVRGYLSRARDEIHLGELYRDGAKRAIEKATFPSHVKREAAQEHIEQLLETIDGERGHLSQHLLVTGGPAYQRAFGKAIAGRPLSSEDAHLLDRAASLTGSAGGFAVPFVLDPTVIPTSNGAINPLRQIARTETIVASNEWRGVSSAGITASYAAEATESTDNAPTLAQPTIDVERAQAFVPFSIEIGQDWPALQSTMAMLLGIAKDELEATKFVTGAGHGSQEPKGIITAATTTVSSIGAGAYAVGDIYALLEALPPRFRQNASWLGNLFIADKTRQFDTAGGANLWVRLDAAHPAELVGRPFYEASGVSASLTTGQKPLVIGDFQHFIIIDRVGMSVELLPHLLGTNRRPTGQRGLYAYWRNSSDVDSASAFRVLVTS